MTSANPTALARRPAKVLGSLGPWSDDDVSRVVLTNVAGLALVLAGWYESAGTGSTRTGLAWLCVSLGGLAAAGVANGLWLLRGLRAIGFAGVAVLPPPKTSAPAIFIPDAKRRGLGVVSGAGMSRYHRPGCPLVVGKAVTASDRRALEGSGLSPCGVCEP
jgi:hypothetical protein